MTETKAAGDTEAVVLAVEWTDKWPDGTSDDGPLTILTVRGIIGGVGPGDRIVYRRARPQPTETTP